MELDALLEIMESTANMLRGMTLDPAIPLHAKAAMRAKFTELEMAVELSLYPKCDACGKAILPNEKNVGHNCDLHEGCATE